MIAPDLLKILCCPETHQELQFAATPLIERLNQQIASGTLRNRAGRPVQEALTGGLVRADGKILYPIRQTIPVMLADEAISLTGM
ncbi:MAG: Trm112 family protein [Verrucomicrobiota bacterium]